MTRGAARIAWIATAFLLVSLATRIGLALFSAETYDIAAWIRFLGIGFLFDVAVLPWVILPWALYEAIIPKAFRRRWARKAEAVWAGAWSVGYLGFFLVVAAGEFTFWGEFASRFDFIAVDYLVYTHEVLGNIRESYPVGLWLTGVALLSLVLWWFTGPRLGNRPVASAAQSWARAGVIALAAIVAAAVTDRSLAEGHPDAHVEQLSLNGLFALGHAYRHNELDYDRYYPTLPPEKADRTIRELIREPNSSFLGPHGIDRRITTPAPERRDVNVVLISVESLSADYLGYFGNTQNLTPELDRLAGESLAFTNLYATGTRTVRGLEALSVGTPPTPGQSIVRRPQNAGLENLGEELKEGGRTAYWIYGGYGFFDNMNAFFGANGYKVVDRTDLDEEGITVHAENVWGVCDEDLYTLAMSRFDRESAAGNHFFAHIMTTSNHRPYTFPENRIDLPQKYREGGVKYTDWAIGDFLRRAASKPWFDDTLFIITADHTAKAAGKTDLPTWRYHIPMFWYAPKLLKPGVMDRLMSQVDIPPTLLGWMGRDYHSRFFGYDMFRLEPGRERAFISTYQKLGYLKDGRLVVLDVKRKPVVTEGLETEGRTTTDEQLVDEAIAWYQTASTLFRDGRLKDLGDEDGPEKASLH